MKNYYFSIGLSLFILVGLLSCNNNGKKHEVKISGLAQGTYYAITYIDHEIRDLQPEIDSFFKAFDQSASTYLESSVISRLNNNDTSARADEAFIVVFNKSQAVSAATGGLFDITTYPLSDAWGFGFTDPMKLDSLQVDSLLQYVDYRMVKLDGNKLIKQKPEIRLDFNAIAQGYSADLIGDMLKERGITNYLVDVGGEVLANGQKLDGSAWKVGIEKPTESADDPRSLDAIVSLKNKALATSGNYRNYFLKDGVKFSHTINPLTGYPVTHTLLSASVLADDAMTADAYATAFMVMGIEKAKIFIEEHPQFEAHFIYTNDKGQYESWTSNGLQAVIVKNEDNAPLQK